MKYRFFCPDDDRLVEMTELPVEDGIAVAVFTTGFDSENDEVVALSIVDFDGNERFSKTVKPQNTESWQPSAASGGIAPADVEELPELYQFEEEISDLYESASIVVMQHMSFVDEVIESSWVSLPRYTKFDLIEQFCASHCAADYPGEPAAAAALDGIAQYYGLEADMSSTLSIARLIASCYRAFVEEHVKEHAAKGEAYWEERARRLAEESKPSPTEIARERNLNRMNGLLWVAAAIIFISLCIQLYQNGFSMVLMAICGVFAGFAIARAIANFRK